MTKTPTEELLAEIEAFIAETGMAPTIFGRDAVGDPNLMRNLKAGRELRFATSVRVRAFMRKRQGVAA